MKKINILLSTLALVIATLTPMASFAEGETPVKSTGGTTELTKTYEADYGIVIPQGTENLCNGDEFELTATAFLEYGKAMEVSVSSANGWKLKDTKHSGNKEDVSYSMKCGEKKIEGTGDINILTVRYDEHQGSVTLTACDIANPVYAGTYSDTLTFKTKKVDTQTAETGQSADNDGQPATNPDGEAT